MRTGLIVINPAAAGVSGDFVRAAVATARQKLDAVRVLSTDGPGLGAEATIEAIAKARRLKKPLDVVVAIGGDGTVCEIASAIARAAPGDPEPPALVIVPAGRGNSAFVELWQDQPWARALDGAARVRHLDLLRIAETRQTSLLGVNAGLLARIVRLAHARGSGGSGLERYAAAAAEALADVRPFPVRVTVDGETLHSGWAIQITIGGVRRFGAGTLELLPRSVLDDGLLDVCVVGTPTESEFQELVELAPAGRHLGRRYTSYAQGRRVVVDRTDGAALEVEHDGDSAATIGNILTVDVEPAAVPTFAPALA